MPTPGSDSARSVVRAGFAALPVTRTSFVGREAEIERVVDELHRVRLLTLIGPGGIGKTRLAIEVANAQRDWFGGRVAFVDLSAVRDDRLALSAIATGLGIRDADVAAPLDAIRRRLGRAETLLVLDNLEQILGAASDIGALLDAVPTVRIVVTSRAPLHISGEQEHPVAPLELPDVRRRATSDDQDRIESVALFVARARAARPDFELTAANAAVVAQICRRLDGLPLAIELAAARVKAFHPREVLRRLEERSPILAGGPADAPARQRTLRETVRWSYDLLSPDAQASFSRLAVFAGGFTLDAASAVIVEPADLAGPDVFAVLSELVDASLVQFDAADADEDGRYRMLETSREFALDQLAGDNLQRARDRHLAYFIAVAEAGREGVSGLGAAEVVWVRQITIERHNLYAAMVWARDDHRDDDLLRLLAACGTRFWYVSGGLTEGLRWSEAAAGLAMADPTKRGAVLAHAGWMAEELGERDQARDLFQRSQHAYSIPADRGGMAEATMGLAFVAFDDDDLDASERLFATGLAIAQDIADHRKTTEFLVGLGLVAIARGRTGEARGRFIEAHRVSTDADDWWAMAWSELNLGYVDLVEGLYQEARTTLIACDRRAQSVGEPWDSMTAKGWLGYATVLAGDLPAARDVLRDAFDLAYRVGSPSNSFPIGVIVRAVAEWLAAAGLLREAVTLWSAGEAAHAHRLLNVSVKGATDRLVDRPRRLMSRATYEASRNAGLASPIADALEAALMGMEAFVIDPVSATAKGADSFALSPRELEVLALVAAGRTDGEIAEALFISKKTASVHVAHIKDKLAVDSRVEVALIGARLGSQAGAREDPR